MRFLRNLKVRLQDCFRQELNSKFNSSEWFRLYRSFKHNFECEKYFQTLQITKFRVAFTRFRIRRNDLRNNCFSKNDVHCPFCKDCTEDENHFLLNCSLYKNLREKYLDFFIKCINSNGLDFTFLINGKGCIKTRKVSMFIFYAMKLRGEHLDN